MAETPPRGWLAYLLGVSRPLLLLAGGLLYALGAGIARYLGATLDAQAFLLGQAWVLLLQLGVHWLDGYYAALESGAPLDETATRWRNQLLVLAAGALTVTASLSVMLIRALQPAPGALLVMAAAAVGGVLYAVPPLRLAVSGYGELLAAILLANLGPALAFLLQAGELHRLVAMSTFPLTLLLLAALLAGELPGFAAATRARRTNLLVRLGWQNGVRLHNLLVAAAFLLFGLALSFGLPLAIILPVFISLPLGLLQVWQLRRIADGARPNWTAVNVTAAALCFTAAYLLLFGFWTR